MHPDRIAIGAFEEEDGDAVAGLYASLEAPIVRSDVNSAEMIKLAANAALMTRISFINEIANVCEAVGADVVKVAEGIGLRQADRPALPQAGLGYGGSCFPKDSLALKQLASNSGYHFQLLAAVIEVNELQKRRVIGKLERHLGSLRGKKVALLGLAFKPNTDDMREAPSIVLAGRLVAESAEVRAWDPVADGSVLPRAVEIVATVDDAVRDADAAVIVTEWPELQEPRHAGDPRPDGEPADHRRPQPARSRGGSRRRLRLRGDRRGRAPSRRPRVGLAMEAIILCGGKAERLGDAAGGRPKSLVEVGAGRSRPIRSPGSRRQASTA